MPHNRLLPAFTPRFVNPHQSPHHLLLPWTLAQRHRLTPDEAQQVWQLQQAACRVEAGVIGCERFPPLDETVADLRAAEENFLLAYEHGALIGALSGAAQEGEFLITRVLVHPGHMRRGIARNLLYTLFASLPEHTACVVTAEANFPALALYRSFGFERATGWMSLEGIPLVALRRGVVEKR